MPTIAAITPSATTPALPQRQIEEVEAIDCRSAFIDHDREKNTLHFGLYDNKQCINLSSFTGEMKLTAGGSTLIISKPTCNSTLTVKLDYYWCGAPRDGIITSIKQFDGQDWKQIKYTDRT
jgi:hypothetical protein